MKIDQEGCIQMVGTGTNPCFRLAAPTPFFVLLP